MITFAYNDDRGCRLCYVTLRIICKKVPDVGEKKRVYRSDYQ